jgi:hypothetical protein
MIRKPIFLVGATAIACFLVFSIYAFRPAEASQDRPTVYEFMQFSTVESVVPGGMGRSRILTTDQNGQLNEKELKNFFSMVGINFGNIANNDRAIVDRINQYAADGWELVHVSTGSHAQLSNGSSSGGLFITRYLFKRPKH